MNLYMDFEDANFHFSKLEIYKYLLQNEPCWWNETNQCWVVTRYDDVTHLLKDHENFTTEYGISLRSRIPFGVKRKYPRFNEQPLEQSAADRYLITKILSTFVNHNLDTYIEQNVDRLLSTNLYVTFDIVKDVLKVFPPDVICEMLGIPVDQRAYVTDLSNGVLRCLSEQEEDNIINTLSMFILNNIPKNINHITDLDLRQKITYSMVFILAGHITITSSMSNMVYDIVRYPEEFKKVKTNKKLINNFIEESLRFSNTTQGLVRTCTKDYKLYDKTIKRGDAVLLAINAANLDPSKWGPNSFSFSIDRIFSKYNLAFGHGPHQCMGMALARKQMTILLNQLTNYQTIEINEVKYKDEVDLSGSSIEKLFLTIN